VYIHFTFRSLPSLDLHFFVKESRTMSIIGTILIGLIVGFLARAIKPGDDKLGWIMTAVLGVAGSLLANFLGSAMGWYRPGETAGWIASVIGAVILLVLYGLVAKKRV
jgi:uncharacterized membrane protein YeaQ/YmgE (transglycosylase-associated protein family)